MAKANETERPPPERDEASSLDAEREARKRRRIDAQMLAALYSADEDELDRFRRQRLGRDSEVTHEDMLRARELLEVLTAALRDDGDEQWRAIERAWAETTAEPLTAQPPDSVTDHGDIDDDRPTTPPAPPAASRPSWPGNEERLSDSGETPAHRRRSPETFDEQTPPHGQPAWGQQAPPPVQPGHATPAAQVAQAQVTHPQPAQQPGAPWGQAYAPGSLPPAQRGLMAGQPTVPLNPHAPHPVHHHAGAVVPQQQHGAPGAGHHAGAVTGTHGTHPMTNQPAQVQAYAQSPAQGLPGQGHPGQGHPGQGPAGQTQPGHSAPGHSAGSQAAGGQAGQLQGPPSSVPFQTTPRLATGEAREPTPPLFSTQRVDPATAPAPMSSHTPVHDDVGMPPPSERTDPQFASRTRAKTDADFDPTQTVALGPAKHHSHTTELRFGSTSHPFALSIEEYATLCAQRDVHPDNVQRTEKAYEIYDDRVRDAVDRAFELRFEQDEELESAFKEAYARSKALLVTSED